MKFLSIFAAGIVAAAAFAAAPASAQDRTVVRERTVVTPAPTTHTRVVVRERTSTRRSYGHRPRQVCTVRYRHGHRIRTCRTMYGRY